MFHETITPSIKEKEYILKYVEKKPEDYWNAKKYPWKVDLSFIKYLKIHNKLYKKEVI